MTTTKKYTGPVKPVVKRKSVHYVDNKKLYADIMEYQSVCYEAREKGLHDPRIPDSIGIAFFKMASRRATAHDFSGYPFKDEMIADGYEECLRRIHSFKRGVTTNAFAYFTTVIFYAFIRRIKVEKRYLKTKMMLEAAANISEETYDSQEHDDHSYGVCTKQGFGSQQFTNEFMGDGGATRMLEN